MPTPRWHNPVPHTLIATEDSMSFQTMKVMTTGVPVGPNHPGAFGAVRKNHRHEGVDIYVPQGTPVYAVEDGEVVAVENFTGESADPPSPWWRDTKAIMVKGASGTVLYGEVLPTLDVGQPVYAGEIVGFVLTVLKKDKGRPMSMLHLELYEEVATPAIWAPAHEQPTGLCDPTPYLLEIIKNWRPQ